MPRRQPDADAPACESTAIAASSGFYAVPVTKDGSTTINILQKADRRVAARCVAAHQRHALGLWLGLSERADVAAGGSWKWIVGVSSPTGQATAGGGGRN